MQIEGSPLLRPLPPLARQIIEERLASHDSAFVFASPKGGDEPISHLTPTKAIARQAERGLVPTGFSSHDIRRTCMTGWARLGVAETVCKKLLGHQPGRDVTASVYNQHSYVGEMLDALVRWQQEVQRIVARGPRTGEVIQLRRR